MMVIYQLLIIYLYSPRVLGIIIDINGIRLLLLGLIFDYLYFIAKPGYFLKKWLIVDDLIHVKDCIPTCII